MTIKLYSFTIEQRKLTNGTCFTNAVLKPAHMKAAHDIHTNVPSYHQRGRLMNCALNGSSSSLVPRT